MTRYGSAVSMRQALEARLRDQADTSGTDLGRLRRRVLFERVMARLSALRPGRWVLKGGAAMEFRLLDRARSTKDLDLAIRSGDLDGDTLREELIETLGPDLDGDNFVFRVAPPSGLQSDGAGRPAYRFGVEARLAGKQFAAFRLDAVLRPEEIAETHQIRLPGALSFAEVPVRSVEAVHPRQHFAEKLHALTKSYGDRPNTRVKDLVDLVLLIEAGLVPGGELVEVCRHVFTVRDEHDLPGEIVAPPPRWEEEYPVLARGLTAAPADLAVALTIVRDFWRRSVAAYEEGSAGGAESPPRGSGHVA
ncbi:nucleotidyl transferase AbiEii/AbiGii toxin family protein [Streptosporangium sp. NPDC051022]|uniref:nucleotidyl transferase AbiEii/AbiGii toxin family protein n=1 Tax=Streptosporangium sp. NPDC051022 TaxID=3155752 RepID=UPI00342989EE